jgi:hypothetical protein
MQPMSGIRCSRTEHLVEKVHQDSLGAAHLVECSRRPGLALDHLGEQSEVNAHDFTILGKLRCGLLNEGPLLFSHVRKLVGKPTIRLTEPDQDLLCVFEIEEIHEPCVLPLNDVDFQRR